MSKVIYRLYLILLSLWFLTTFATFFDMSQHNRLLSSVADDGTRVSSDFALFYCAGSLSRTDPVAVYDQQQFSQFVKESFAPLNISGVYQMQYPPHYLFPFAILSYLPMQTAWFLKSFVDLLFATGAAFLLTSKAKERAASVAAFLILLFSSFPAWICVRSGQFSFSLLFALSLFFYFLKEQRVKLMSMILPFIKLQYVPAIAATGLSFGKLHFLQTAMIAVLAIVAISILLVGWQNFLDIPAAIFKHQTNDQLTGAVPGIMQNFRGALVAISGQDNRNILLGSLLAWLASLAAIAYLWMKKYPVMKANSAAYSEELCMSISILLMLGFSLNTYVYDYVAAIIPCYFLYCSMKDETASKLKAAAGFFFFGFPVFSWVMSSFLFTGSPVRFLLPPMFVWNMILLMLLIIRINRN